MQFIGQYLISVSQWLIKVEDQGSQHYCMIAWVTYILYMLHDLPCACMPAIYWVLYIFWIDWCSVVRRMCVSCPSPTRCVALIPEIATLEWIRLSITVTYMCVSWFWNWAVQIRYKVTWMGATQYSRSHDRHVHCLTSPPAWHHCAILFQNNTCNNSTHHPLLAFGWADHNSGWVDYIPSSKGQDLDQIWAGWSVVPLLCLCWKTYPRPQHNPIHFCFKHALLPFPCLHCTNTGNSLIHTL